MHRIKDKYYMSVYRKTCYETKKRTVVITGQFVPDYYAGNNDRMYFVSINDYKDYNQFICAVRGLINRMKVV